MTGLILCGGKSSRMGRDKAFLEINGKPLLALQIERLEFAGYSVVISGPKGRGYERFGKLVVEDSMSESGPLAGLVAGFLTIQDDVILALAIDLPNVTISFLSWLPLQLFDYAAVCPVYEHGFEPLCAVYNRQTCLPIIQKRLQNRELSLQSFMVELDQEKKLNKTFPREWKMWGDDLLANWNAGELKDIS